jgi:hypothetical protein
MLHQKTEKKHIESWDKKITNYWVHKKWVCMQTPIKCERVFPITIPTTDVSYLIIHKRSSQKKKKKTLLIVVDIVENWRPLGCYYMCITQDVFCILIPQLLKFWKIQIEIA